MAVYIAVQPCLNSLQSGPKIRSGSKNSLDWLCLLLVAGAASNACHATSSPDDTIKPYVASSLLYDSNFLRLSDNAANGNSDKSEFVKQIKFGFDMDWKLGQQHLIVKANANQNWFQNFSVFDYLGWNTQAQWDWRIQSNLSGEIGYNNTQQLGNFDLTNSLIGNLQNNQRFFASAGYLFHPSGKLRVEVFRTDNQLDDPDISRRSNQNIENNISGALQYLSPDGSIASIRVIATQGEFPLRPFTANSNIDNAYTRLNYGLTWNWLASTKSSIEGLIGYTQQNYANLGRLDFADVVGMLAFDWKASEKLFFRLSFRREIDQFVSQTSSFLLRQGVWVDPTWQFSTKISVAVPMYYQQQEFLGSAISDIDTQRKDNVGSIGLNFKYKPLDNITAGTILNYENRDSTENFRSYKALSAGINLDVAF